MINLNYIIIYLDAIVMQTWLVGIAAIIISAAVAVILCRTKSKKLIHENNTLLQRIVEGKELLEYSKQGEQNAKKI